MTDCTVAAPLRATKAPTRPKATPSSAPAETPGPTAPDTGSCTEDERLVINTLREQMQQIYDLQWGQIYLYSNELLLAGVEALENVDDSSTALHRAAALAYGALTMQKVERPGSAEISVIEAVFKSLNSAAISYGFAEEGCVALANGIRAGLRQFQERPTPPIRRADGPTDGKGPYNHAQLCAIITGIASVALTLDRVLMLAQLPNDDWDTSVLIDTAQLLARQLGGMADSAVDGQIIGTHDVWNYGPNFAALGKAGAA